MDDRLQRRLMDADPLAAPGGPQADPARLDALREQIMQSDQHTLRAAIRPRAIGGVALVAASLAIVLAVASLARPTATTLAWERVPTQVTDAQKAAADAACNAGLPGINGPGAAGQGPTSAKAPDSSPVTSITGAGTLGTGGGVTSGGAAGGGSGTSFGTVRADGRTGTIVGGTGDAPAIPTELPPLVSLELHGNGGIAIFADDATTAYCLLVSQGDGFKMGGLLIPSANGSTFGVVGIGAPGDGQGPASGQAIGAGPATAMGQSVGATAGDGSGLTVNAMAMSFDGTTIGLIAGVTPAGAASIQVSGGPADGGTATVTNGRFALWSPGTLGSTAVTVTALDAAGHEVTHQTLFGGPPPGGGFVEETTHP